MRYIKLFYAVLGLLAHFSASAHADFRLCNNTRFSTFQAFAYEDKDKGWASVGWFEVRRLSCETLISGSVKGKVLYHFAEGAGVSWHWPERPDDRTLCVGQKHAETFSVFRSEIRGSCEAAGFAERRFSKVSDGNGADAGWELHWNAPLSATEEKEIAPRDYFRECGGNETGCPQMVVVPAGEYMMGSPDDELGRHSDEGPRHKVAIRQPFAIAERWVTRAEYARFVDATGHDSGDRCKIWKEGNWIEEQARSFRNPGFTQDGRDPVVCVNLNDARTYVAWLSKQTGRAYRLPSEAEWEYVIRAGTTTPFWWGPTIASNQANYNGNLIYAGGVKGEFRQRTISALKANAWRIEGLGNAAEWTEDCWSASYQGAPGDGAARTAGNCALHALRGGSWASDPTAVRSAARAGIDVNTRANDIGFRVARTLAR
jgi:formylglycine-generating enzyme required for sulfatase activity/uncharacterized membrane protein